MPSARVFATKLLGVAAGTTTAHAMSVHEWAAQPLEDVAAERCAKLESGAYVRADVGLMQSSGGGGGESHAIFETLGAKTNALKAYRIYSKRDGSEIVAVARLADGLDGHKGIVHGGVTALLFDNTFGWANAMSKLAEDGDLDVVLQQLEAGLPVQTTKTSTGRFGFTANLAVNYRSPVLADSTVQIHCKLDTIDGRKRKLVGTLTDLHSGKHLCDATALFVIPRNV